MMMNVETTYDVVVLAEAGMYTMVAVLALAAVVYALCAAWHQAASARCRVQFNRIEWEQQRQSMLHVDDSVAFELHPDTVEFYKLDDE